MTRRIAFIGGGNMASAIIGGLIRNGMAAADLDIVEPWDVARQRLQDDWGLRPQAEAGDFLARADMVVWAVKPQTFHDATTAVAPHTRQALHLSVAAGIPSSSIAQWLGNERVIRSMPNTPALIGQGVTGLFARDAVTPSDKEWATQVISTTGATVWLQNEAQLDAVTALSGSGPAYVFYFLEAMTEAGTRLGLEKSQAYALALATFSGASALAQASDESPESLRAKVTSKGGTTHAAITSMDASGVKDAFVQAMEAAHARAQELAQEFGAT
jgi:pyrroline-5-carboxylate reductase